jgi:hypothetical protein
MAPCNLEDGPVRSRQSWQTGAGRSGGAAGGGTHGGTVDCVRRGMAAGQLCEGKQAETGINGWRPGTMRCEHLVIWQGCMLRFLVSHSILHRTRVENGTAAAPLYGQWRRQGPTFMYTTSQSMGGRHCQAAVSKGWHAARLCWRSAERAFLQKPRYSDATRRGSCQVAKLKSAKIDSAEGHGRPG